MNIDRRLYNASLPADTTLVKDLPRAIREKGEEVLAVIETVENNRTTSSIKSALETFPNIHNLFLKGNVEIPSGLYTRNNNIWYGFSNYDFLPPVSEETNLGERITYNNKTFQFFKEGEVNVWAEKPSFEPLFFYDFFAINDVENLVLPNLGIGPQNPLELTKIKRTSNGTMPYILTSKNSTIKTTVKHLVKDTLTVSATFNTVSREYATGETIEPTHSSVVIFIRDEFFNVNVGLGIDKDNQILFLNGENIRNTNSYLDPNKTYQLAIKYIGSKLFFLVDGFVVFSTLYEELNNKYAYFSFGDDNDYGRFANSHLEFGEPHIFGESISKEENVWIKQNPRTWSMKKSKTYFDLTHEENIDIKHFLNTKPYKSKLEANNGVANNLKVETTPEDDLHVVRKIDLIAKANSKHSHQHEDLSFNLATHEEPGIVLLSSDINSEETDKAVTPIALNSVKKIAEHSHPYASDSHSHEEFQQLLKLLNACKYDIGDIYITKNETVPEEKWPGTKWLKIEDRIISATSGNQKSGTLQGSNKITINKVNLPEVSIKGLTDKEGEHFHTNTHSHKALADKHSHSIPPHNHKFEAGSGNGNGREFIAREVTRYDGVFDTNSSGKKYIHDSPASNTSEMTLSVSVSNSAIETNSTGEHAHNFTTELLGSGVPIGILPEVIRYHIWERLS